MMANINVDINSLLLRNPIILAAGILGSTGASLRRIASSGAGAVVTKSIGVEPNPGYPGPVVVRMEYGFLNAMGLPNPSYNEFIEELRIAKDMEDDVPLIASIFGTSEGEFVEIATALCKETDALELNVSCPHVKHVSSIGSSPASVEDVTRAVKEVANVPVWVKLSPNVTDIVEVGSAAQDGGADAIVAINTVKGMAIDIHSGHPILGNKFGGLSGRAIKPIAIKCVYDLYAELNIPIVGVGGVSSWEDAIEFIMAGATAVQMGSAVYKNIEIFKEISSGISAYLDKKETTLNGIMGIAHDL
jgi:dihydroorotate dehydrogenase (NAD+) catalytic subunit